MEKVKLGVVGVGALGKIHAKLYKDVKLAELVGVYDHSFETAQAVAAELGVQAFATIGELPLIP